MLLMINVKAQSSNEGQSSNDKFSIWHLKFGLDLNFGF
jgi:hypothetical protein